MDRAVADNRVLNNFTGNFNLTILDETEIVIGDNAVPFTAVAGNPARIIKKIEP